MPKSKGPQKPVNWRKAVTMYRQGWSLRKVADQLGVSHQAVHKALLRMGVELRARGGNQGSHVRRR